MPGKVILNNLNIDGYDYSSFIDPPIAKMPPYLVSDSYVGPTVLPVLRGNPVRSEFPNLDDWINNPNTRDVGVSQRSYLRDQFLNDNPAPTGYRHVRWAEQIRREDRLLKYDGTSVAARLTDDWVGCPVAQFFAHYEATYKDSTDRITVIRSINAPARERKPRKPKIKSGLKELVKTKVNGRLVRRINL